MEEQKTSLLGMTLGELRPVAASVGLPPYAARQMADWLYKKRITRWALRIRWTPRAQPTAQ